MDYAASLAKEWDVTRVVTDQAAQQAVVEELGKRGVTCHAVPWTGRSASGRSKPHRYGRVKQLINQGRLTLPDNAELRSEFTEVSVRESATDPGFQIETHGPDDQLDASIMAITEALKPKRPNSMVHDFGPQQLVIPGHQRHLGTVYGGTIPAYAIDRD